MKDIRPGDLTSDASRFTGAGSLGFFAANDGTHGKELWITKAADAGTVVVDIRPGGLTSRLGPITAAGDSAFFSAFDGVSGQQLWTSDGTVAGTHLVKNFNFGSADSDPNWLTEVGDVLVFAADGGGLTGTELWKTDGTSEGTKLFNIGKLGDLGKSSLPNGIF